jgi:polyisoprenoid-binding protein YceI
MRRLIFAAAVALIAATPSLAHNHSGAAHAPAYAPVTDAPAGVYGLDPTHASVTWRVMHLGMSRYTARFAKLESTLEINPATPETARLTVSIDPTSVRTDYPNAAVKDFDKALATEERWFNAGKFPAITFVSTKVERTGQRTAKVTGDLTFLGITKATELDVVFNGGMASHPFAKVGALGFSATGRIKRSDFGMTALLGGIGDEVDLQIEVEYVQKK